MEVLRLLQSSAGRVYHEAKLELLQLSWAEAGVSSSVSVHIGTGSAAFL